MLKTNGLSLPRVLISTSRRSYSLAATRPTFTSYFFHNSQWSPSLSTPPSSTSRPMTSISHPTPVSLSAYKTPSHSIGIYAQLAKSQLTALVVLSAMSSVALSPLPASVPILLSTALGTAMCSASANTLNQLQEVPFDAQMARTRTRPLVRRAITPLRAAGFAAVTGIGGPALLWGMVNPTTAILGAANIVLYAGSYTAMKRSSIWNTWVGSLVGAIPPLMGWTACGGRIFPSADYPVHLFFPSFLETASSTPVDLSLIDNPLAPFALGMLLFSWQFPHFNAFSHYVRGSYAQAGYHMLPIFNTHKNSLVALRHALLMFPICSVLFPLSGLTTWAFALTSLVPNGMLLNATWKFHRAGSEKSARSAFRFSLLHLPLVLALAMIHKQGLDWAEWVGIKEKVEKVDDVE